MAKIEKVEEGRKAGETLIWVEDHGTIEGPYTVPLPRAEAIRAIEKSFRIQARAEQGDRVALRQMYDEHAHEAE